MPHPARARWPLLLLVLLAVGGVALLFGPDLFRTGGGGADDEGAFDPALPEREGEADAAASGAAAPEGPIGLATLYGDGDLGAVRLRLRWVGSGQPVAGHPVRLLARRGEELAAVPTDPEGVALFPQVAPGRGYQVHIPGEGFSEVLLRAVEVQPQAVRDLGDILVGTDIVLRGRVLDALGRPLPGTSVSVHAPQRGLASKGLIFFLAEQAGAAAPPALGATQTDADGYFAFAALADGRYALVARHAGYAARHADDVIVARERGAGVVTVVLAEGTRLVGTVTDEDGRPVAGAQVVAVRDQGRMMGAGNLLERELGRTGADGRYALDTLARGARYRVGVVAEGFAPLYDAQPLEMDREEVVHDIALVRGGTIEGLVVEQQSGRPVAGAEVAVLAGRIPMGPRRGGEAGEKAAAAVGRTDAQGAFRLDGLVPGPVMSAVVKAHGHVSASFTAFPPPGNPWPDVVAGQAQTVRVELLRGGIVRGVVRSAEDDRPIAGAEVSVLAQGFQGFASLWVGTPSTTTGADGTYELVGVPPGTYGLHALADGWSPPGGTAGLALVVPPDGGTVDQDVTLTRAGRVHGTVTDPQGEPVAAVRLRLEPRVAGQGRMGGMMRMAEQLIAGASAGVDLTDATGRYEIHGVYSGLRWVLVAESDEYVGTESEPFEVGPGEARQVDLVLAPGGTLRGRVLGDGGRWLAGARVRLGRLPDDLAGRAVLNGFEADRALDPDVYTSDAEGRFVATNLPPGRLLLKVEAPGYMTWYRRSFAVAAGQTVENFTVTLTRGATIEGTVRGADGAPLAGALVGFTTQAEPGQPDSGPIDAAPAGTDEVEPTVWARSDEAGRYRLEQVPPGRRAHVLVWFAPGHQGFRVQSGGAPSEKAIRREVVAPAADVDFRLDRATAPPPGLPAAPRPPGAGGGRGPGAGPR